MLSKVQGARSVVDSDIVDPWLSLYSNSCLLPKSHQPILTLTDVSDHPLVVKHQRLHDHVTIEICMWIHIRFTFEQCICLSVIVAMNPHNFLVDLLIKHKSVFTLLDLNWRKDIAILRNVSCKRMQQNLNIYKNLVCFERYRQRVVPCKAE